MGRGLTKLLTKFEPLFDGTLGTSNTDRIDLELKDPDTNFMPDHILFHKILSGMKWFKLKLTITFISTFILLLS
jgi:hypothetical protein